MDYHWSRPLSYILDDDGVPVACEDLEAWTQWWGKRWGSPHTRVGEDVVGDTRISTSFLGDDVAVSGPPVVWETAIFCSGRETHIFARYSSRVEAQAGHAAALELAHANPLSFWSGDEPDQEDDRHTS
jgi:hypothetical protein